MFDKNFTPIHINATHKDLEGNNGIGRYILFPGSNNRAKKIAEHFLNVKVKEHSRGHHLYLGTLNNGKKKIDVAAVSSGMGTPSTDIIFNELVRLGGKRFLRVGTSGSLQYKMTKLGDFVIATGAVRDEGTSRCYLPLEFPAIASHEVVTAAQIAAKKLKIESKVHTGLIHSKDSLYAREFGAGPMQEQNKKYVELLESAGVIASEMEAALLFIASSYFNHLLSTKGSGPKHRLLSGAICVIISNGPEWADKKAAKQMTTKLVDYAIEVVIELANSE